jgi:hypothetical protein
MDFLGISAPGSDSRENPSQSSIYGQWKGSFDYVAASHARSRSFAQDDISQGKGLTALRLALQF